MYPGHEQGRKPTQSGLGELGEEGPGAAPRARRLQRIPTTGVTFQCRGRI